MNIENQAKDYSENPQEIINESFDIIDNLVDFDKIPESSRPIIYDRNMYANVITQATINPANKNFILNGQ